MYKNDLSAAHARIRSLEQALAKKAPKRQQAPTAKAQSPPRRRAPRPSGFPIYYRRPGTHWPLLVDFFRAAERPKSFKIPPPNSDSLLLWLGYFLIWPIAHLLIPAIRWFFYYALVLPAIFVVVVPVSVLLAPVAVLSSLKVRGKPRQGRSKFWAGNKRLMSISDHFMMFGFLGLGLIAGVSIYLLITLM